MRHSISYETRIEIGDAGGDLWLWVKMKMYLTRGLKVASLGSGPCLRGRSVSLYAGEKNEAMMTKLMFPLFFSFPFSAASFLSAGTIGFRFCPFATAADS